MIDLHLPIVGNGMSPMEMISRLKKQHERIDNTYTSLKRQYLHHGSLDGYAFATAANCGCGSVGANEANLVGRTITPP